MRMNDWKRSLIEYFEQGIKQKGDTKLGLEAEHFIVHKEDSRAVSYYGEGGVKQILEELMAEIPDAAALPGRELLGFQTPEYSITLEPAAQMEISIIKLDRIAEIESIYEKFMEQLRRVLEKYDYTAATVGCQPVSPVRTLRLIPKKRYDLMDRHFEKTGTGGIQMMRGTASLQVSVDYSSEEDFRQKVQAAYYYGPYLKLLCDNAAVFQGEQTGNRLMRTDIWRRVEPSRCGILPNVFSESYGFGDYADFIGNVAPIFLPKGDEVEPTGSRTVAQIYEDHSPDHEEIVHLLSMAFPDIRLKQYLEIRLADMVPQPYVGAYAALIKGLLYSEEAIEYAQSQIRAGSLQEKDIFEAENAIMKDGWDGIVYGKPVRDGAEEMLKMAERSLPENEKSYLGAFDLVIKRGGIARTPQD